MHYETDIRAQWLHFFSFYIKFNIFCGIARLFLAFLAPDIVVQLQLLTLESILMVFWFFLTYHFGYVKRGTKWLIFELITVPLFLIHSFYQLSINDFSQARENYIVFGALLANVVISLYYWVASYRLYLENRGE